MIDESQLYLKLVAVALRIDPERDFAGWRMTSVIQAVE